MAIALRELFGLTSRTACPDRADRVDDPAGRQVVAGCDLRLTGFAATQLAAGLKQFGSGRAVDGTIDTATAQQRLVGGIDDGVHGQGRDVGLHGR